MMGKRNWFWDGLGKLSGLSRFSSGGNGTATVRSRKHRATSQRKRSLLFEPLECRQLLSVAPTAPDTSGLDPYLLAQLASMTPHPHTTGDQPTGSAQMIPLSAYTEQQIIDPGIPTFEPYVQEEQYIDNTILNNSQARPSYWGETAQLATATCTNCTSATTECRSRVDIDWGDGSPPQQVGDQPWVAHQYAGGAGQFSQSP